MCCMVVMYVVFCLVLIFVEVVIGGNMFILLFENIFFKNYGNVFFCVIEYEEEICKFIILILFMKWFFSFWSILISIWIYYLGFI